MNTGFWFSKDDYGNMLPRAGGALHSSGLKTALMCQYALVRVYYSGNPTPRTVADEIMRVEQGRTQPTSHEVYYVVGNEPNNPFERWQGGLDAYVGFYKAVRALLPPSVKTAWAGMSPQGSYLDWYTAAVQVASQVQLDAVVVHAYGQSLGALAAITEDIEHATGGLPLILGECNFGPGAGVVVARDAWAGSTWAPYLDWLRLRARWLFSLYFAYTWTADTPIGTPVDAEGTQIVNVTLRKSIDGTQEAKLAPLGRSWWVWYVANCGGIAGIIDECQRTRVRNVFIKAGDGPYAWDQLNADDTARLVQAGINVYAWHYFYGGWLPGTPHGDAWHWNVEDEVKVAQAACNVPGVRGFVADAEAECEGRPMEATRYALGVRSALGGRWFGYAPLPVIDFHLDLPYVQFNNVCDGVLPQFYAANIGGNPPWTLSRLVEQWRKWYGTWQQSGLIVPTLMPVGDAYGQATEDSLLAFEGTTTLEKWEGWSYWSLEHAVKNNLIKVLEQHVGDGVPNIVLSDPDRATLRAMFDNMWHEAEQVHALLGANYGDVGTRTGYWAEFAMKGNYDLIKEVLGLN